MWMGRKKFATSKLLHRISGFHEQFGKHWLTKISSALNLTFPVSGPQQLFWLIISTLSMVTVLQTTMFLTLLLLHSMCNTTNYWILGSSMTYWLKRGSKWCKYLQEIKFYIWQFWISDYRKFFSPECLSGASHKAWKNNKFTQYWSLKQTAVMNDIQNISEETVQKKWTLWKYYH